MVLSIVVPAIDEAHGIAQALERLQPLRRESAELIVVDGGSRDATATLAARFADRVLAAPRGRAVQMNVGASIAQGDTLLFLHADCRLPDGARDAIDDARARGHRWGRFDVALVGRSRLLPVVATMMNARSRLTGIATGDQAMFVERAAFDDVGGFSPLPLMEDVALSKVLKARIGAPACIRLRAAASGRRWDRNGAWSTIATMWSLRYAYWRGADAAALATRYYRRPPVRPVTLQVFAKPPLPGRVKTRLAQAIGAEAAADVYARLVRRTLDIAARARRAGVVRDVELWIAPGDAPGALADWSAERAIPTRRQQGADLGERMRHATSDALAHGAAVLLIGTDVPGYDVAYLAEAAAALERADAVFGPAEDGGYVLAGLAREVDAFAGVAWSTSRVMAQTRERLAQAGASCHELAPLFDVDTEANLMRWQASSTTLPVAT